MTSEMKNTRRAIALRFCSERIASRKLAETAAACTSSDASPAASASSG
jgi:hypothetical protein